MEVLTQVCRILRDDRGLEKVALGGGVFQNRTLLTEMEARLRAEGFQVFSKSLVPSNDGGISLGQAVAAHYMRKAAVIMCADTFVCVPIRLGSIFSCLGCPPEVCRCPTVPVQPAVAYYFDASRFRGTPPYSVCRRVRRKGFPKIPGPQNKDGPAPGAILVLVF